MYRLVIIPRPTLVLALALALSAFGVAAAVNGACGSAQGGTFHLAPAENLCAAGEAGLASSDLFAPDTWVWSCSGVDGGNPASCTAQIPPTRAVLVLGGGNYIGNDIWDATLHLGQYAYQSLRYRKLEKSDIKVLSPVAGLDLDGDGNTDDEPAYLENLEAAITVWGRNHRLILYFVGHGGDDTFELGPTETLYAADLEAWIETYESSLSDPDAGPMVIFEACHSGSFLDSLTRPGRVMITSTSAGQVAYILNGGLMTFSHYFWDGIARRENLWDSFDRGKRGIGFAANLFRFRQAPQFDMNGDAITTLTGDRDLGWQNYLVPLEGFPYAPDPPVIADTVDGRLVAMGEGPVALWAEFSGDEIGVDKAWAVIMPPGFEHPDTTDPITELPQLELSNIPGTWFFFETYDGFSQIGDYRVLFYGQDTGGQLIEPQGVTFSVMPADQAECHAGSYRLADTLFGADQLIVAEGTLSTQGQVIVAAGATLALQAGGGITLNPGFHARAGSGFRALAAAIDCQ